MLISTSRKPSSKTRAFCKNLSHALGCEYINRGKMSMRELQLKSIESGYKYISLVYEMNGNPSKITFFSNDGDELVAIIGSVNTTNERLHIKTDDLTFQSDLPELNILREIFNIDESQVIGSKENFVYIEKLIDNYEDIKDEDIKDEDIEDFEKKIAIIHFYNKYGDDTGLKINLRKIVS